MAHEWVDFKLIRERVGIVDILTHYGLLDTVPSGEQFKIHCPFHEDTRPSCNIHTGMQAFNCFGCHAHGGVLMFVRLKEGIATGNDLEDDRSAGRLVQEWFGLAPARKRAQRKRNAPTEQPPAPPEQPAPDERIREENSGEGEHAPEAEGEINQSIGDDAAWFPNRDMTHEYLTVDRGLSPDTIEHFRVGYHSGRGMMSGRIVIPIHNERSELVAYAGRFPGVPPEGEPKYKLPPKFKASHVVFNLHRVPPDDPLVILVEGFFDVIELFEAESANAIALMGTNLSTVQEQLLIERFHPSTKILIAFDPDEAGERCADDCLIRLGRHFWVNAVPYDGLLNEFKQDSTG